MGKKENEITEVIHHSNICLNSKWIWIHRQYQQMYVQFECDQVYCIRFVRVHTINVCYGWRRAFVLLFLYAYVFLCEVNQNRSHFHWMNLECENKKKYHKKNNNAFYIDILCYMYKNRHKKAHSKKYNSSNNNNIIGCTSISLNMGIFPSYEHFSEFHTF